MATRLAIFITGTGTDVGKTFVAGLLARGLQAAGAPVSYWKPVQTGIPVPAPGQVGLPSDTQAVQTAAPLLRCLPEAFVYPLPAAPDQAAAAAAQAAPSVAQLCAHLATLSADILLIEGAGGLLVPLNAQGETWADFAAAADLPVLVVATSGLGTINHTVLTLEVLAGRGLRPLGVVLSGEPQPANIVSIQRQAPAVALHALPRTTPDCVTQSALLASFVQTQLAALATSADASAWQQLAADHVWFPYTQHATASAPVPITRAAGVWLTTASGEKLFDATSSWWVNTIGHGRPAIGRAIAAQQQRLDHVLFAGAVHEPAARLAARLVGMTGGSLNRVFFSDNGSTAVEVALKMAYQTHANRGERQRRLFLSFRGSYHGDTFGAMSVAQSPGFHGPFAPLLFDTLVTTPVTEQPSPVCPEGREALTIRLAELRLLFAQRGTELAGVILEPLVQGAGGMLMQPLAFVQELARLCHSYGVPLILDEVFTGLGRLGADFAFRRAGIVPDIVAAAKGLTGGNLPLAVTLAKEEFFTAFLAAETDKALLHGHSYTANPIACAAALATLQIYQDEGLADRALAMEKQYRGWLHEAGGRLGLEQPRCLGGIFAFELPGSGGSQYFSPRGAAVGRVARSHGLFLRPLGNTLYLAPPLASTPAEIDWALAALAKTVVELGAA